MLAENLSWQTAQLIVNMKKYAATYNLVLVSIKLSRILYRIF